MESEAPPSAALYNFLGWLNANKKPVAAGVAVVALIVGVVLFMGWQKEQKEIKASLELSNIRLPYNAGELPPPGTDEALLKLAAAYPGTSAGTHAMLLAGTTLFAQGNYSAAQAQLEKFMGEHGDSRWASHASYALAACLDAQNKTNDAIAKYEAFIKTYPADPAADHAQMGAALLYEQSGRDGSAVEIYKRMLDAAMKNPNNYNQVVADAQEHLQALYKKNPALAMPKTPPVKPTTPTVVIPSNRPPVIQTNIATATNSVKSLLTNLPPIVKTNLPIKL